MHHYQGDTYVRRHAKASFVGSTQGSGMRRGLLRLVCVCVLGLAAFLGSSAPSASAQACPNEAFRTGYGANLADCRAYEMASPVNKEGQGVGEGDTVVEEFFTASMDPLGAANGEAAAYQSSDPFNEADPTAAPLYSRFVARRGASDWSSEQVEPPIGSVFGINWDYIRGFTPNLDQTIVLGGQETPLNPEGEENTRHLIYRNSTGSFQLVSPGLPPDFGEGDPVFLQGLAADGSHVVFRTSFKLTAEGGAGPYLYDWSAASETLTLLAESANVAREGEAWHSVSEDGSRIFTSGGGCGTCLREGGEAKVIGGFFRLANRDGSAAYVTEGSELYRYDVASEAKVNLTEEFAPAVQGVVGASEDASRVYFAAENSLYLWTAGSGIEFASAGLPSSAWLNESARVSANGMHVAFTSTSKLTEYENAGVNEIYAYDAGSGVLSCASCNPLTEPPEGSGASIQASGRFNNQTPRSASNGGQVFFSSEEVLVAGDVNGQRDAYEYDSASGQTSLISSGTDRYGAKFVDAGASGRDVFFITREQLVPVDQDESADLYDARAGGGLASQNPPSPTPPCTGEACHPEASSPDLAGPASAGFVGRGNISAKQNCNKLGKEAKKLSKRAKRLRKNAKKAGNASRAKKLNKKSNRLAKQARNKSKSAKKCRKRNRGASK